MFPLPRTASVLMIGIMGVFDDGTVGLMIGIMGQNKTEARERERTRA